MGLASHSTVKLPEVLAEASEDWAIHKWVEGSLPLGASGDYLSRGHRRH